MPVIERTSCLGAPPEVVWSWVTTPAGINDELRPWLRMTRPRGWASRSIADVTAGTHIGRSWVLLLGVLPFDADDITIAEIGPGRFLERSRLLSAPEWSHERLVRGNSDRCELHDRVTFEPRAIIERIPGGTTGHAAVLRGIFSHRHRRLRRRFGGG